MKNVLVNLFNRSALSNSVHTSNSVDVIHMSNWMATVSWSGTVAGTAKMQRSINLSVPVWSDVSSEAVISGSDGSVSFVFTETEPGQALRLYIDKSSGSGLVTAQLMLKGFGVD
jgi:hypothetical protein